MRKKEKKSDSIIVVLVGCIFIIGTGIYLRQKTMPPPTPVRPLLLSIQEIEERTNIEVLMPSQCELQEWILRKGGDLGPKGIDGFVGPNTIDAMEWVRCQQEASRHYPVFEKGYYNGK